MGHPPRPREFLCQANLSSAGVIEWDTGYASRILLASLGSVTWLAAWALALLCLRPA